MPTIALLDQTGKKLKDIELSANVFGIENVNKDHTKDIKIISITNAPIL